MFRGIFLLIIACLVILTLGGVQDVRYQATCTFDGPREAHFQHDCHVALFSYTPISFSGKVFAAENDFCTASQSDSDTSDFIRSQGFAVMVKRGNCAFSTKALHAQQAGFQLVIIANSEEEGFPVGPPELDFVLDVPVVMVGQKVWDQVYDSNVDRALSVLRNESRAVDMSEFISALEGCHTVALTFGNYDIFHMIGVGFLIFLSVTPLYYIQSLLLYPLCLIPPLPLTRNQAAQTGNNFTLR